VNFRPIILKFTLLKRTIFAATRPQFVDRPLFGILAFQNEPEYRNCDLEIRKIGVFSRKIFFITLPFQNGFEY